LYFPQAAVKAPVVELETERCRKAANSNPKSEGDDADFLFSIAPSLATFHRK
jgi:hypothetical protein